MAFCVYKNAQRLTPLRVLCVVIEGWCSKCLLATNLVCRLAAKDVQKDTGNNKNEANGKNDGLKASILKCFSIETDSQNYNNDKDED